MIQYQLKLRPNAKREQQLEEWLWMLTGVHNFASRKIEQDADNKIYHSKNDFQNLLIGHGKKMGIPSHTLQGMLANAYSAWDRCFKKISGKPQLKGQRNKLNSIPFPDPIKRPDGNYIKLPSIGMMRFHKQKLPEGKIKCGRLVKRASGWYLCLFIDTPAGSIPRTANGEIGIDPGFKHLLTTSDGEKVAHPRELEATANRLAQAQRGKDKKLAARLQEKIANQRKDRNHKLSRRLVSENQTIIFSKDNHKGIAKRFGKSVASSSHGQLRSMLAYKSPIGGTKYIEVNPAYSTKTCSACGCLSGPSGLTGLSVRDWTCVECGTPHDRDINAAVNTFISGAGAALDAEVNHHG